MPIKIPLFEGWEITSDKHQYMLSLKNDIQGYYISLEDCLQAFVNKKLKLSNATSWELYIKDLKTFQRALQEALLPLQLKVVPMSELREKQEVLLK